MSRFFFVTNKYKDTYKYIKFVKDTHYIREIREVLKKNNHAFCYELYIPNKYITKNINNKYDKILKVTEHNKKYFQNFNYYKHYIHDKNYECPYPLFHPCHPYLLNNFVGIDATEYNREDNKETYSSEGIIWQPEKINIGLILIDYIEKLPTNPI